MSEATVYLAEPIDQAGKRSQTAWGELRAMVNAVASKLEAAGFNIYRPATAWTTPNLDPRVEMVNREALRLADCVVGILPAGVSSIGVPMEMQYGLTLGIPAVVLSDVASVALAGQPLVTVVDELRRVPEAVRYRVDERRLIGNYASQDGSIKMVIRDGFDLPTRAYPDDAGVDLITAVGMVIEPHGYADIQTQVEGTELPDGYFGLITGRSSTVRKHRLMVPLGIIDPGWRGPLFVGAQNLTDEPVTVKVGERVGQLILLPNTPAGIRAVTEVSHHDRGLNGFGSSGA